MVSPGHDAAYGFVRVGCVESFTRYTTTWVGENKPDTAKWQVVFRQEGPGI